MNLGDISAGAPLSDAAATPVGAGRAAAAMAGSVAGGASFADSLTAVLGGGAAEAAPAETVPQAATPDAVPTATRLALAGASLADAAGAADAPEAAVDDSAAEFLTQDSATDADAGAGAADALSDEAVPVADDSGGAAPPETGAVDDGAAQDDTAQDGAEPDGAVPVGQGVGGEAVLPVAVAVTIPLQQAAALLTDSNGGLDPAGEAGGRPAAKQNGRERVPGATGQHETVQRETVQRAMSIRIERLAGLDALGAGTAEGAEGRGRADGTRDGTRDGIGDGTKDAGADTVLRPLRRRGEDAPVAVSEHLRVKPSEGAAAPAVAQRFVEAAPDDAGPQPVTAAQTQPLALQAAPERAVALPVRTDMPGWEQVLGERIAAELSEDGQEIDLTLSPEKLGPLKIKLEMVDGLAQVRIITATPEAARLFNEAQHRLSEGLARAGVEAGQQSAQSAGQGTAQNGGGRQGDDRPATRARMTEFLTRTGRAGEGDAPALRRAGAGLVNLMA